ncbi:MAG: trehalase-like domain-containing protein, partial [Silvibacterium sp.]
EAATLVGKDGSIDWLCWRDFSSPACFAALLGTNQNGRWRLAPKEARAAQPSEMAPLFVFLASHDATYVTGGIFGATGGQTPF